MSRREYIEKIIIGTLLESKGYENWYDDCRCSVSADMFRDATNRRIFELVADMNAMGKTETTPCDIMQEYGAEVMDIACDMVDLCTEYSFIHLKTKYNEERYIENMLFGSNHQATNVEFVDYVKKFVQLSYWEDERQKGEHSGAVTAAA